MHGINLVNFQRLWFSKNLLVRKDFAANLQGDDTNDWCLVANIEIIFADFPAIAKKRSHQTLATETFYDECDLLAQKRAMRSSHRERPYAEAARWLALNVDSVQSLKIQTEQSERSAKWSRVEQNRSDAEKDRKCHRRWIIENPASRILEQCAVPARLVELFYLNGHKLKWTIKKTIEVWWLNRFILK